MYNHSPPVFERVAVSETRQFMEGVLSRIRTELELKDCTFKPTLVSSYSSRTTVRGGGGRDRVPIYERLNKDAEKASERQQAETLRRAEQVG